MELCDNKCFYCCVSLTMESVTMDHVMPLAKGGSNSRSNLVAACAPCNSFKSNRYPTDLEMFKLFKLRSFHMDSDIFDEKWNEASRILVALSHLDSMAYDLVKAHRPEYLLQNRKNSLISKSEKEENKFVMNYDDFQKFKYPTI